MGTGTPLTVRQDSPSAVGSGICWVAMLTGLICWPYTLIRPPGATGWVPSAAFTTLRDLGRRHGGVVIPRQHHEAGNRKRDDRAAVGQSGARVRIRGCDVRGRRGGPPPCGSA